MESKHEIPGIMETIKNQAERIASLEAALTERTVERDAWINYAFVGSVVPNKGIPAGERKQTVIEQLQSQLAEARSQIEAAQNFAAQLESNIKFLNERVEKAEAQLADYGKPVTDEEWNFDEELLPTPALKEMFKRMRATFDDLLRRRTQSGQGAPMSERSAGE